MIDALKKIGTTKTIAAANSLELIFSTDAPFSLHLRNAELNLSDAKKLAMAIKKYEPKDCQVLNSFSVSYNASIGDLGSIALVRALPDTVSKIGLAGCDITDTGGLVLLEWAKKAPNLRMMCVENNKFSNSLKTQIRKLTIQQNGLIVIV